jgi:hypothetical protein
MYQLPSTFTNNWMPKMMPLSNLILSNNFENFNINAMSMPNNYPPPPPPPLPLNNFNQINNMAANPINQQINTANTQMNVANNMANNMAYNTMGMANDMGDNMNANMNIGGGMNMNMDGMNAKLSRGLRGS